DGRPLPELAVTHHVDADGVCFDRLDAGTLGGQVHGEGRQDILGGRDLVVEGHDRDERAVLFDWHTVAGGEFGVRDFNPGSCKVGRLAGTGEALFFQI